jgi:trehalose 6-phosphate synthase/phosphatase
LENNLAHKRPIEGTAKIYNCGVGSLLKIFLLVLIGKKNIEVRPVAINKGEIVKRIVYNHPEADFIFCAGDDKTDEDMFRALNAVSACASAGTPMEPPISVTLVNGNGSGSGTPKEKVELAIKPQAIFTTSVGHSSKRTLANWHVTSPEEIVEHMLVLVNGNGTTEEEKSNL